MPALLRGITEILIPSLPRARFWRAIVTSATAVLLDITEQKAKEYLEELAAKLHLDRDMVKVGVDRGEPAKVIVETARRMEADMIVLATHGKKGAAAFWSGSLAPKISGQYRRPLLLVPVRSEN